MALAPSEPGIGIDWDWDAVKAQIVAEFTTRSRLRRLTCSAWEWCIGLKPEKIDEYKRLHAAVWPEVLAMISACNITQLFDLPEGAGKPAVRLFRISRHRFCRRHGEDGGRPEDPGMVGGLHAAARSRLPRARKASGGR